MKGENYFQAEIVVGRGGPPPRRTVSCDAHFDSRMVRETLSAIVAEVAALDKPLDNRVGAESVVKAEAVQVDATSAAEPRVLRTTWIVAPPQIGVANVAQSKKMVRAPERILVRVHSGLASVEVANDEHRFVSNAPEQSEEIGPVVVGILTVQWAMNGHDL